LIFLDCEYLVCGRRCKPSFRSFSVFQVDLYSDADNVQYGNKTVTVYKNTVKFSTAVSDWQFNAGGNQLRYTIFMGSQGKGGSAVSGSSTPNRTLL
jgi:hypothetical protein